MANRMGMYFAALLFGCGLGIWGCWIAENDKVQAERYYCAHGHMERGVDIEAAYGMCK